LILDPTMSVTTIHYFSTINKEYKITPDQEIRSVINKNESDKLKTLMRDNEDNTINALKYCADLNKFDMMQILVNDCGADINGENGITLLISFNHYHSKMADYLVDCGISLDSDNDELLRMAIRCGHEKTVRKLVELGADISKCEILNHFLESETMIRFLLENGADVHYEDDRPLIQCCEGGYTGVVKILLEFGADIHVKKDKPLRYATAYENYNIMKILLENGADVHTKNDYPLRTSVEDGEIDSVKLLLEYGANIHVNNEEVLIGSISRRDFEMVQLLIDSGANLNGVNDHPENMNDHTSHMIDLLLSAISPKKLIDLLLITINEKI